MSRRRWPVAVARLLGCLLAPALLVSASPVVAAEEPVLNILNWSDYIAPGTIAAFEAETGIRVRYDVFDANEVLEAKLLAGRSGYDIVVPSAHFVARQIVAGVFQPLDRARLPGLANLDPEVMRTLAAYDPGNAHVVPWLWGTTGLGYNVTAVEERLGGTPPASWQLLLDPANAARLADCGIALLDAPMEVIPSVLIGLGLPPNSEDPAHLDRAFAALEAIRPHIRYFHSGQYINDLANGEICLALGYSGDILMARARAEEAAAVQTLRYVIPEEGALVWFDVLAIPKDARQPGNAHRFIEFVLRPEVIAEVSNAVRYANANLKATALVDEAIRMDPGIYPDAALRARLVANLPHGPKFERRINRAWSRLKAGRAR
ncbi:MAG TPA: spermidine/putrescine ABC transporter substrate-binding protein PotF [Gammaproteobacteria bacterium]|nr:spermidine/putrescine ABC transporter substrate-binding protein PotF [Gammaproteobacteria bacterium]